MIEHGRLLQDNMRRELITEGELLSQLRLRGVQHPAQVETAYMEGDGRISVVQYDEHVDEAPDRPIG